MNHRFGKAGPTASLCRRCVLFERGGGHGSHRIRCEPLLLAIGGSARNGVSEIQHSSRVKNVTAISPMEEERINSRTEAYARPGFLDQFHSLTIQIGIAFGHDAEGLQLFAEIDLGKTGTAHND